MAGDNHFPPEMWREILVRLPAKSILRWRSVCKSWYSLISCPNFISYYSSKTLNKNRNRILLQLFDPDARIRSDIMSFSSVDESFMESREHDDFSELHAQDLRVVGSCDGLICLSKYRKDAGGSVLGITFFVWNPTIRKVVEISSRIYAQFASYIGFGFDYKTSDYKILCMMGDLCEICDLSKGVWRRISPLAPPWRVGPPRVQPLCPECYLDGIVHWSGERHPNSSDMILLSFNMSDECFRDIKMPDFPELLTITAPQARHNYIKAQTVTFGGLIYVIAWNMMANCSVWVMKEYGVTESWTEVSNISMPKTRISPETCLFLENGEVLMKDGQNLILYNTERRISECVFPLTKCIVNMCLYEESLVLM